MKSEFAIVAIAKNENLFVEEWINYHLATGFDHIYLYDNGGPDDDSLDFIVERYPATVTVEKIPGPSRQSAAYRHFCDNYKQKTSWVAFIDLDEFITFPVHKNVQGFVSEYENLGSIGLSWHMFGHASHTNRPTGFVMDNYTWRYPFSFPQIKTLCSTQQLDDISSIHNVNSRCRLVNGFDLQGQDMIPFFDDRGRYIDELDTTHIVRINHYFTRSMEDFKAKIARGSAAGAANPNFDWYTRDPRVFSSTLDMSAPRLIRQFRLSSGSQFSYYQDNKNFDVQLFDHVLPNDFDPTWYREMYPDVKHLESEHALKQHFKSVGALDGRAWSAQAWAERYFDPSRYLLRHSDVANAGNNLSSARYHYFVAGRFENREIQ